MTDEETKARIAALLAEDGPLAALAVLRLAAEWAVRTLTVDDAALDDDVLAFRAVVALDDALDGLGALEGAVPALVETAAAGAPVRDHLRERQAELARTGEALAADRAALDELGAVEQELADSAAEHDRLRGSVAELRRLSSLAGEVDALRAQHDALRAELDTTPVQNAERETGEAAEGLLQLSKEQIALLDPRVRIALEEAATAHTELTDLRERLSGAEERIEADRAELAAASEGFERLRTQHEDVLAPLRVYQRADRELAAALSGGTPELTKEPGLQRADQALDEVEQRLDEIDALLGRALAEHTRIHEQSRTALNWTS